MNRAEILAPNGTIDTERLRVEPRGSPLAEVTVREWSAAKQRHVMIYKGALNFEHVSAMAADRASLEDLPQPQIEAEG